MFWDQYRKSRCCVGTIIKNVHECPAWRSMLSQRKQYSCIYFTQVLQTCTFPQVENTGSFFRHSDGFVRSPAGAPHYYHSTAASRRREEETSNGNAATSPTEGTNANVVSNGAQSTDSAVEFVLSWWDIILFTFISTLCFWPLTFSPPHDLAIAHPAFCSFSFLPSQVHGPDSPAWSLSPCDP